MHVQLNDETIRLLCGRFACEDGQAICRAGKVALLPGEPGTRSYEATVAGDKMSWKVAVEFAADGRVKATCSCPLFHPEDQYCEHIAAALYYIRDLELDLAELDGDGDGDGAVLAESGETRAAADAGLMSRMLELFDSKPLRPTGVRSRFDSREMLEVEFTLKPLLGLGAERKNLLGVELKVGLGPVAGAQRLYEVKNIKGFLGCINHRESCRVSRQFTYDPELHSFRQETDAILHLLIQAAEEEAADRGAARRRDSGRLLPIPPAVWEELLPLLAAAPSVKLVQGDIAFDGLRLSDESLPLVFAFDQAPGQTAGYRLDVQGLNTIIIMESYGVVLAQGELFRLPPEHLNRLCELADLLDRSRRHQVYITPEQAEPFMEKVVPGLMKLGRVQIAEAVSERMTQTPLQARLFLDRIKDRLLASLEFQYGDIVINPLEGAGHAGREGRILLRDGEKERQILQLLESNSFVLTEGGYILADEGEEYDFLYRIVPELRKLVQVYATSAVRSRLFLGQVQPRVKIEVDERTNWLDFAFEMEGIPEAEIRRIVQSLEEKRPYHRLPGGVLLPLETAEFRDMYGFLSDMGVHKGQIEEARLRLPVIQGLQLMDYQQIGSSVQLGKSFRRLLEKVRNPDHQEFPVPAGLDQVLRDYQKYGFQWMKTLADCRFGGVLADEMGLGKTIQSIAFLVSALPEIQAEGLPALIVCPASLMYNWQLELGKFAPGVRVVIADGSKSERDEALDEATRRADVIITSYPLLRRDWVRYAGLAFHTVILDEAQAFKNYQTQTAQAVKALQARYRFALTGTPIENRVEELWSIFDIVLPGLFPGQKAFGELSREAVARRIRPFLLRRLKADVLKELPEKIESLQASRLLPEQKKLYAAYLAELREETLKHLGAEGFGKTRIKILAGLTRLRQLCCHPALFVQDYAGSSAKFEQLMELVQEYRSAGRRLLVFSQFTQMLGLIGRELGAQGVPYFYLDGQTPAHQRVELCGRFNEGERDLFLLSLKAGGTGLNLTGADTIILYDLWWNPAVEQQAADRAHRIGQKNVVHVIRLVAEGTIEEKMYKLQEKKRDLIHEVIQSGQPEPGTSALSEDEIRELLMI